MSRSLSLPAILTLAQGLALLAGCGESKPANPPAPAYQPLAAIPPAPNDQPLAAMPPALNDQPLAANPPAPDDQPLAAQSAGAGASNLTVMKTGPKTQVEGGKASFVISVANDSQTTVTNLTVSDHVDPSLQPTLASRGYGWDGADLIWKVDRLPPGKSIQLKIECACTEAAENICTRVTVTSDQGDRETAECCLTVTAADATSPEPSATKQGKEPKEGAGETPGEEVPAKENDDNAGETSADEASSSENRGSSTHERATGRAAKKPGGSSGKLVRGLGSSFGRALSKAAAALNSEPKRPPPDLADDPFPNGEPTDEKPKE